MTNPKDHLFIIFGTYGANTLGQIRSLGEKGIHPIAVLVHKSSFRIDKSKYLAEVHNANSIEEGLSFIIKNYGNIIPKPFLYTDRDDIMGLLDRNYDELKDKFYFWNAGEQGRLNKYLNKEEQLKLAEACGMRVPKTEVVKVGELPKSLSYPIFTKAIDSLNQWWKGCAYICQNEEELKTVYQLLENVDELMLQEYIDKQNEIPYEGISFNGGEEVKLLIKSVNYRFTKDSFGIYRHLEPFDDKDLEAKVQQFILSISFSGVFEVEFIIDKHGTAFFLEANFRVTQYNSAYTMFGVNLPYIWAKSILENRLTLEEVKYVEKRPFNVMSEFEDFRLSCLHGSVSLYQWLNDIRHTDCFQYYDQKDRKPFIWTIWSKLIG